MKFRIRGLSLWVLKGQSVIASRADDHVCVARIVLSSTNPEYKEARIELRPGGNAEDMRVLGVKAGAQTFTLTAATAVEVLPGLLMGIGVPDEHAAVRSHGARLVFKDPPHLWHIEREQILPNPDSARRMPRDASEPRDDQIAMGGS